MLVKEARKGQVFYECDGGRCVRYVAKHDPVAINAADSDVIAGYELVATNNAGKEVDFYQAEGYTCYPRLYSGTEGGLV